MNKVPLPSNLTVEELRKAGFKVRISHFRTIKRCKEYFTRSEIAKDPTLFADLSHAGGKTVAEVRDLDGNEYYGESICSAKDSFCYKRGVRVSLGRAINKMNIPSYFVK